MNTLDQNLLYSYAKTCYKSMRKKSNYTRESRRGHGPLTSSEDSFAEKLYLICLEEKQTFKTT